MKKGIGIMLSLLCLMAISAFAFNIDATKWSVRGFDGETKVNAYLNTQRGLQAQGSLTNIAEGVRVNINWNTRDVNDLITDTASKTVVKTTARVIVDREVEYLPATITYNKISGLFSVKADGKTYSTSVVNNLR